MNSVQKVHFNKQRLFLITLITFYNLVVIVANLYGSKDRSDLITDNHFLRKREIPTCVLARAQMTENFLESEIG